MNPPSRHLRSRPWFFQVFLACLLLSITVAGAMGRTGAPPIIFEAVCDGDGVTWGIVLYENNGLYRLEHDQWVVAAFPGLPGKECRPLRLTRRTDGSAVCLWEDTEARRLFTVHRGSKSEVAATFPLTLPSNGTAGSRLFADSRNNVWFTSNGPDICRFSPAGTAEKVHVITGDESRGNDEPGKDNVRTGHWNSIGAFEDAKGSIWFYTDRGAMSGVNLRGVLHYDGKAFSAHDLQFPGEDPLPYLGPMAAKDADHLWVCGQRGLYTLDTTTFELVRLAGQPEDAGPGPEIFHDGEGFDFIFNWGRAGQESKLWRLHEGEWQKLIDPVDAYTSRNIMHVRLWQRTPAGLFIGTSGNGLWYVPDGGAPEQIDWRRGFPLRDPTQLLQLPGENHWLAFDGSGRNWIGDLQTLVSAKPATPNSRLTFVPTESDLVADHRRHLWGLLSSQATALSEWDGTRWLSHDLPKEGIHDHFNRHLRGVAEDQRIWVSTPSEGKDGIVIYDPAKDQWQVYEEFRAALEAQADLGATAGPPESSNMYDRAAFGPNRQICYLTRRSRIAWYDGAHWQDWTTPQISGAPTGFYLEGAPFFSDTGRLRINLSRNTFEKNDDGTWHKLPEYEPSRGEKARAAANRPLVPPPGVITSTPDSIVLDNEGASWLTWRQQLYRCRFGLCVPMFAPGEAQPFIDGRKLTSAFIDARGNAVFRSVDYLILAPSSGPPQTRVTLAEIRPADDHVQAQLSSDAGPVDGKLRFEWRLDGGAWQPLLVETAPALVALEGLPGGEHRLQARSLDRSLQTDVTPAEVTFEITIDPGTQIAGYVAQLADADFARRKLAVEALARQPERALPALQAARLKCTDDSQRWWIDAALQKIQSNQPTPDDKAAGGQGADRR